MARKKKKYSGVDPAYLDRQRDALKRKYRKSVFFNEMEISAIDEFCKRSVVMDRILSELDKSHPTLF